MKNKFKFLVGTSLKRKIKTKWFLIANIFLALVIIGVGNIDNIIKQCNQEDYERRVDAIKDNFERVKKFYCVEDWLFNEYGELFL